jgi:hypothetical protein
MKKLILILSFLCISHIVASQYQKHIIGTPYKLDDMQVAQYDFPNSMTYEDAKYVCSKLGEGWRLPTKYELNNIYQNKDQIKGFVSQLQILNDSEYYTDPNIYYWSDTEYDELYVWIQGFTNTTIAITKKSSYLFVRAVNTEFTIFKFRF